MNSLNVRWSRGAATLGVLAVLAAAALASNAASAAGGTPASKGFVRKQVRQLRADAVASSGRVGIASDTTLEPVDPASDGQPDTQLTVLVTAPAPGFIIAEGSMETFISANDDVFSCYLTLNGVKVESSLRTVRIDGDQDSEANCDTDAAVPVQAGTQTIALVTTGVVQVVQDVGEVLHALYVPYDGNGVRPT
jgi:hypothetical protein